MNMKGRMSNTRANIVVAKSIMPFSTMSCFALKKGCCAMDINEIEKCS